MVFLNTQHLYEKNLQSGISSDFSHSASHEDMGNNTEMMFGSGVLRM